MFFRTRIITKAIAAFAMAAAVLTVSGPAFSGYLDGLDAYKRADYQTALEEWSLSALQGDFRAQFGVGILHYYGRGTNRDLLSAASYFREASDKGYPAARYALALMYQDGMGIAQDLGQAKQLYELAAWQGMPKAQNNLGILYAEGEGVELDLVLAHVWFSLAARGGVVVAKSNRDRVATQLSYGEAARAKWTARGFKETAVPEPPPETQNAVLEDPEKPTNEIPASGDASNPTPITPAP